MVTNYLVRSLVAGMRWGCDRHFGDETGELILPFGGCAVSSVVLVMEQDEVSGGSALNEEGILA